MVARACVYVCLLLPFFVQKVRRVVKGFFYQTRQNTVIGFFGSFQKIPVAELFYHGDFLAYVLDGGSSLQQLAGSDVHLEGREAPDLEFFCDKAAGFRVVLDGRESHVAIDELLIDDAVSHFHGEAIELESEPLALFAPRGEKSRRAKIKNNNKGRCKRVVRINNKESVSHQRLLIVVLT